MARGGRVEPATASTERCGGETGPDSGPSGALAASAVETRRHSDEEWSVESCQAPHGAFGGPKTTTGKGFPRQIQTGGWAGQATGPLGVYLHLTDGVRA